MMTLKQHPGMGLSFILCPEGRGAPSWASASPVFTSKVSGCEDGVSSEMHTPPFQASAALSWVLSESPGRPRRTSDQAAELLSSVLPTPLRPPAGSHPVLLPQGEHYQEAGPQVEQPGPTQAHSCGIPSSEWLVSVPCLALRPCVLQLFPTAQPGLPCAQGLGGAWQELFPSWELLSLPAWQQSHWGPVEIPASGRPSCPLAPLPGQPSHHCEQTRGWAGGRSQPSCCPRRLRDWTQ